MSNLWFGNNKNCQLDSVYNERAGPRNNLTNDDRKYYHQVLSASSSNNTVPHYAQASQLYPMRPSLDIETFYNKKPIQMGSSQNSPSPSYHSGNMKYSNTRDSPYSANGGATRYKTGQPSPAVVIPVVHLGNSSNSTTPSCNSPNYQSINTHNNMDLGASPSTAVYPRRKSSTGNITSPDHDQDLETLTNILLQSIDSRSSSQNMMNSQNNSSSGLTHQVHHSGPGTPTHEMINQKRISSNLPVNTRINRLQQQYPNTSSGRGSPLATNNNLINSGNNSGTTGNNSPNGSLSSGIDNTTPNNLASNSNTQNICFRCHRYLMPLDQQSSGPSLASNLSNNPNIVTINGALSARLHVACFTCYRCQTPLKPDSYYHTLRRLLCPSCVKDGALETCYTCRRPIGDRVIRALGLPYHPSCFICCVCNQRLESCPFTVDVHGKPHCLNDFHRKYAPKCTACGRPITPEQGSQEARRVVDGDNNYHLECFTRMNNSDSNSLPGIKSSLVGTLA